MATLGFAQAENGKQPDQPIAPTAQQDSLIGGTPQIDRGRTVASRADQLQDALESVDISGQQRQSFDQLFDLARADFQRLEQGDGVMSPEEAGRVLANLRDRVDAQLDDNQVKQLREALADVGQPDVVQRFTPIDRSMELNAEQRNNIRQALREARRDYRDHQDAYDTDDNRMRTLRARTDERIRGYLNTGEVNQYQQLQLRLNQQRAQAAGQRSVPQGTTGNTPGTRGPGDNPSNGQVPPSGIAGDTSGSSNGQVSPSNGSNGTSGSSNGQVSPTGNSGSGSSGSGGSGGSSSGGATPASGGGVSNGK